MSKAPLPSSSSSRWSSLLFLIAALSQPNLIQCEESLSNTSFLRGTNVTTMTTLSSSSTEMVESVEEVEELNRGKLYQLAERMKPRSIDMGTPPPQSESNVHSTYGSSTPPRQFFHLHHMKSGGTSLSGWINCGKSRLEKIHNMRLHTSTLSECSKRPYDRCIQDSIHANSTGVDDNPRSCKNTIDNATIMNFCSPLAVTNFFNWDQADAVTMMRDPVARVWSMYRFQTKYCFKCQTLTQVYKDIESGVAFEEGRYGGGVCLPQIMNHITRNMQKNIDVRDLDTVELSKEERLADAIDSIQNRFTVVGVIEQLEETIEQFSYSFPWLSEELEDQDKVCKFPHSNGSPSNNHCGENGGHWNLPDEPDEETRRVIEQYNDLDIKVYEAALKQFEWQKVAMRLGEDIE